MQRHQVSRAGPPAVRAAAEANFIKANGDGTGAKIASDQAGDDGEKRHKQHRRQGEHHGQRHLTPLRKGCDEFDRGVCWFGGEDGGRNTRHSRTFRITAIRNNRRQQ